MGQIKVFLQELCLKTFISAERNLDLLTLSGSGTPKFWSVATFDTTHQKFGEFRSKWAMGISGSFKIAPLIVTFPINVFILGFECEPSGYEIKIKQPLLNPKWQIAGKCFESGRSMPNYPEPKFRGPKRTKAPRVRFFREINLPKKKFRPNFCSLSPEWSYTSTLTAAYACPPYGRSARPRWALPPEQRWIFLLKQRCAALLNFFSSRAEILNLECFVQKHCNCWSNSNLRRCLPYVDAWIKCKLDKKNAMLP